MQAWQTPMKLKSNGFGFFFRQMFPFDQPRLINTFWKREHMVPNENGTNELTGRLSNI